ncbi:hypothetical protein LCGC14_2724320, partial [marine sediment metagenome]
IFTGTLYCSAARRQSSYSGVMLTTSCPIRPTFTGSSPYAVATVTISRSRQRRCPLVLTPHPGEFSRLTDRTVKAIQSDRIGAAIDAVTSWADPAGSSPILVLKGAGTVVTDGRRVFVNGTGNPGMATGGTGDVLTGLIAAVIGQGLAPFDAACLGVHVHGAAGDLAAEELGEASLTAVDLIDLLPEALARDDT